MTKASTAKASDILTILCEKVESMSSREDKRKRKTHVAHDLFQHKNDMEGGRVLAGIQLVGDRLGRNYDI
jgi:hypothetical protein